MKSAVALLTVLTVSSLLTAETVSAPSESTIVLLVVPGQFIDSDEAASAVQSHLEDLPVVIEVRRVKVLEEPEANLQEDAAALIEVEGAQAVIWVDLDDPSQLNFLAAGEWGIDRYQRTIPVDTALSIRVESLATMCRATVLSLLAMGAPPSTEKPSPEETHPTQEPVTEATPIEEPPTLQSERTPVVGIDMAYEYGMYSSEQLAVHGLAAGLHGRLGELFRVFAVYELRQPLDVEGACVDATLRSHPVHIGSSVEWRLGDFSLGPKIEVTLDYVTSESTPALECPHVQPVSNRPRWDLAASIGATSRYHITGRFSVFAELQVDIFIIQGSYVAPSDSENEVLLFDPWPAQPAALLGISVEVI